MQYLRSPVSSELRTKDLKVCMMHPLCCFLYGWVQPTQASAYLDSRHSPSDPLNSHVRRSAALPTRRLGIAGHNPSGSATSAIFKATCCFPTCSLLAVTGRMAQVNRFSVASPCGHCSQSELTQSNAVVRLPFSFSKFLPYMSVPQVLYRSAER